MVCAEISVKNFDKLLNIARGGGLLYIGHNQVLGLRSNNISMQMPAVN
jgi:hypothetical protein